MKKISFIAAILICGLLYTTCDLLKDQVKEPEVTLKSVDFTEITFEGLTLLSKVDVKNNVSVDIPFPKIDWDLNIIDLPFVNGSIPSGGTLKSNASTEVEFPVSFTYANLIKIITGLTDENAKYKINLTAYIPVPGIGDFSFPFSHDGKVPIARIPEITFASAPSASFTYGSSIIPGLSGVPTGGKIEFALDVKNKSNVAILIKDLSIDVKIGNVPLPKQGVVTQPKINAGSSGNIPFQFSLNAADALSILPSVISGGGISGFNLTGNYNFSLPDFPFLNDLSDSITLK